MRRFDFGEARLTSTALKNNTDINILLTKGNLANEVVQTRVCTWVKQNQEILPNQEPFILISYLSVSLEICWLNSFPLLGRAEEI